MCSEVAAGKKPKEALPDDVGFRWEGSRDDGTALRVIRHPVDGDSVVMMILDVIKSCSEWSSAICWY